MRRGIWIAATASAVAAAVIAGIAVRTESTSAAADHGPKPTPSTSADLPSAAVTPSPTPTVTPTPVKVATVYPTLRAPKHPSAIKVTGTTLFGWTLVTRGGQAIAAGAATAPGVSGFTKPSFTGSVNDETTRNTVESMIKGWIAADWLRRTDAAGKKPTKTQLNQITLMIIDSNNKIAQEYYNLGGRDALIKRIVGVCGLRDTVKIKHDSWSFTEMTPADAARYGECLADGRAAGPKWTSWLLRVMTQVRGGVDDQKSDTVEGGRWGIVEGLPESMEAAVSMKNGWTLYVDGWHINCLAIGQGWVLSVMVRTPSLQKGADACASVARQLLVTH